MKFIKLLILNELSGCPPQAAICAHSKYTYTTWADLYPQLYPDVIAEGLGLNRTTTNYLNVGANKL